MIEDLEWGGPGLPVATISRLFEEREPFRCIKVETYRPVRSTRRSWTATGGRLTVAAGWAVPYLLEALARGIHVVTPGGLHWVMAEVIRRYRGGDPEGARALFDRLLPILGWQNQHIDISNQFLKLLAVRQGIFAGARLRRPDVPFDAVHGRIADELIDDATGAPRRHRLASGMRAVRWHARGDVRVDDVPVPTRGDSQVLLRIEAAAICGTDVDEVRLGPITVPVRPHPVNGRTAPMTLGHEIVGVVAEAGATSGQVVGARVAPWPSQPCGRCRECTTGHANRCPLMVALGMSADGGMADYLVADGQSCVPVGAEVEPERAVLVEPFAVALHAVHRVPVAGRRVAVVGVGSLGLCVVEAAVLEGAGEVIALSRSDRARELAREAGAAATLSPDRAERWTRRSCSRPRARRRRSPRRSPRFAAAAGSSCSAATPRTTGIDLLDLTVREVALEGSVSHCFTDFRRAAEEITAGTLARARRPIVMAPLEDGPALLRAEDTAVKRVLMPGLR